MIVMYLVMSYYSLVPHVILACASFASYVCSGSLFNYCQTCLVKSLDLEHIALLLSL